MTVYSTVQRLARGVARILLPPIRMRGLDNLPATGPALVVSNHQSILDPILIQGFCPRPLHTMTKSTQFSAPGMAWLLERLNAFPVRRYQIDPQCVRIALRRLAAGHAVGVYIEGERSWDGRLQTPRLGTLRLILKAGVPVVPCAISGAYDVWPRWASGIRRAPVTISFGRPMRFPRLDDRSAREARVPETGTAIMAALAGLMPDAATGSTTASTPVGDAASPDSAGTQPTR